MTPARYLGICWAIPAAGFLACCCGCWRASPTASDVITEQLAAREMKRARSMTLWAKGKEALKKDDYAGAKEYLTMAIREDKRNSRAWMALGILEYKQHNLYEAAQAFDSASKLAPGRYEPHFNMGIVLESARKYSQAIAEYEIALELSPDAVEAMENLARCYIATGAQFDKAAKLIERARRSEYRPEWVRWLDEQQRLLGERGVYDGE